MTGRTPYHRLRVPAAAAAALGLLAGLALALGCTTTGAPRPAASVPPAAAKAPAAAAAPAAPAPPAPKGALEVVGGESFDFGAVWPGDALKHSFVLKNTSGAEVKILRVQPG